MLSLQSTGALLPAHLSHPPMSFGQASSSRSGEGYDRPSISSSVAGSSYSVLERDVDDVAEIREQIRSDPTSPEIIIVGAGIAGSALAYSLSRAGRRILLVERDLSVPDRIVGELLQPGGVAALRELGLGDALEGIDATPVEGYCVVMDGRRVGIPYPDLQDEVAGAAGGVVPLDSPGSTEKLIGEIRPPAFDESNWSTSGRKEGRSFHHGRFIDGLRRKVREDAQGVTILEGTVKNLITCDHTRRVIGVAVAVKDKNKADQDKMTGEGGTWGAALEGANGSGEVRNYYAPITIVADGCFSKFRSVANTPSKPSTPPAGPSRSLRHPPTAPVKTRSHFVGLILNNITLPLPHHGTVCLTPSGPVLLYQIAWKANETRMLVDVKGKLPSVGDGSLKRCIEEKYLPYLPEEGGVRQAVQDALNEQRLRVMPNSFLPPKMQGRKGAREGVIMVGDSWNMRHPLTGGGMTVALHDAVLLTEQLRPSPTLDLTDWESVRYRLQDWYWKRKSLSGVVNVMSIALYDLFGADDNDLAILREGCFAYFELGGMAVSEPVGLLSALTPKPFLLFYHFFIVAFYSIWILFTRPRAAGPGEKKAIPSVTDYPELTVQSARVFYVACKVFLPVIWTELWC